MAGAGGEHRKMRPARGRKPGKSTEKVRPAEPAPAPPSRTGVTVAWAIARDPRCVYAYWEAPGAVAVRLRDRSGPVLLGRAVDVGSWYFEATPDVEYEVEVLDAKGRVIAASNRVRTPPAGPAPAESLTEGEAEVLRALAGVRGATSRR